MTCEELQEQIDTLTAQSETLSGSIASNQSSANSQFLACLAADSYGGMYPTYPPTQGNVSLRIAYLSALTPAPTTLIAQWNGLLNTLQQIYNQQTALAQTNAMLGSFKAQYTEQGC